jgi:hypothetical protein
MEQTNKKGVGLILGLVVFKGVSDILIQFSNE